MSTLFISDLHLSVNQPALTRLFLYFIQHWAVKAKTLYILGDLFESWVGDDDVSPYQEQIASALAELTTKGVKTYFMPGNRDFLIGKSFIKKMRCELLPDPTLITLYGIPTLLMHGDSLCTLDKNYMAFRRLNRMRFIQLLFLQLPLGVRRKFARYLRAGGNSGTRSYDPKYDVVMNALLKEINQFSAQWIIHGHTHQPCIQLFNEKCTFGQIDQKLSEQNTCNTRANGTESDIQIKNTSNPNIKRFVLSDWVTNAGNVLVVSPNRDCQLIYFS